MRKDKLGGLLVAVGVTAAAWGCNDQDGAAGSGGSGGTAGSAGKGGTGGTGGKSSSGGAGGSAASAGKGAGGSAGKGVTAGTGGSAGTAGSGGGGTGGKGGKGGSAGAAGSAGTDGNGGTTPSAGQGGEAGDPLGGQGGEAGAPNEYTLVEACAITCQNREGLSCNIFCIESCIGAAGPPPGGTLAHAEYLALLQCEAKKLGPSDYVCREQLSAGTGFEWIGLVWGGPCEQENCAFTCADGLVVDEQTYDHCLC